MMDGGALCAVIDFGGCAVGDPACDLVAAWTLVQGEARGWALWKAAITLADPAMALRALDAIRTELRRPNR